MSLKSKMYFGLGFLFFIIFGLGFFYSYNLGTLAQESGSILKDNYASIVYSKNMMTALDDMQTAVVGNLFDLDSSSAEDYLSKLFVSGKAEFEKNMNAQMNNITEINEDEYTKNLGNNYGVYMNLYEQIQKGAGNKSVYFGELMPAYEKLRHSVAIIGDINMQAVERRNELVQKDASGKIRFAAIIGSICLLLAFGYFWYFPFYISTSFSYLATRMKGLLKKLGIAADFKTEDEAQILLQSINLLETKLDGAGLHTTIPQAEN